MNAVFVFGGILILLLMYMKIKGMLVKKKVGAIIADGAMIIDVRTPGEFGSGHYKGAINIPVGSLQKNISRIGPKDRSFIVYCASGMRSSSAVDILKRAGFINVFNAGKISNMP
jgi:rhodanese-related sulfurtransferase